MAVITGSAGGDQLAGTDGDDTISGAPPGGEALEAASDTLRGLLGDDVLRGWGGNDLLRGGKGEDELRAGDGADTLDGGTGRDTLRGEAGNDTLNGGYGDGYGAGDLLEGGEGDDLLQAEQGPDTLVGGAGEDTAFFYLLLRTEDFVLQAAPGGGEATLQGVGIVLSGIERYEFRFAGSGNDSLATAAGNDSIYGYRGRDTLIGAEGADTLVGGADADRLEGGDGDDLLIADSNHASVSFLNASEATTNGNGLYGGAGADTLIASDGPDALDGGDGDDWALIARDAATAPITFLSTLPEGWEAFGSDGTLVRSIHRFELRLGLGSDVVFMALAGGADTISASSGNDRAYGGGGGDSLHGSLGNDLLRGEAGDDRLDGFLDEDRLFGDAGNDTITADAEYFGYLSTESDTAQGGEGDDSLVGHGGADLLSGGAGNDTVNSYGSGSTLMGGTGTDDMAILRFVGDSTGFAFQAAAAVTVAIASDGTEVSGFERYALGGNAQGDTLGGGAWADTVEGFQGDDALSGLGGADRLEGAAGQDTLAGGDGDDSLDGGSGGDLLQGGAGHDTIAGGERFFLDLGTDTLEGGAGHDLLLGLQDLDPDVMLGGDGADTLVSGGFADTLTGGAGHDRFRYANAFDGEDVIADFTPGVDRIEVDDAGFGARRAGLVPGIDLEARGRFRDSATTGDPPATGGWFAYDNATGALWWDQDGLGAEPALLLATLLGAPAISGDDILVI